MNKLQMFCLSLEPNHYEFIKGLGYIPVGLGEKHFNENWLTDKSGTNISEKNKYYSECTFHYWLWKNYLDKMEDGWIGFCQYRKFWSLTKCQSENINIKAVMIKVAYIIPLSPNNPIKILVANAEARIFTILFFRFNL